MKEKKYAICLNCIDGSVQIPVIKWIQETYKIDFVDMITDVGIDRVIADVSFDLKEMLSKLEFARERHHANHIFIVGHHDCCGNFAGPELQKKEIKIAVKRIKRYMPPLI